MTERVANDSELFVHLGC